MQLLRLFITYIKRNEETGQFYAGHASGKTETATPLAAQKIMKRRDSSHHKTKNGFGPANIDKISTNKDAIIGREQLLIEHFKSQDVSGNSRNAISPRKKEKMQRCIEASVKVFGAVSIVLVILYLFS